MSELQRMARQRAKGLKRRASETAAKFKERLALKMEHPGDRLDINEETELFSLVKVRGGIDGLMDNSGDVIIDEEEEAEAAAAEEAAANAANAESSGDDDDDRWRAKGRCVHPEARRAAGGDVLAVSRAHTTPRHPLNAGGR